VRKDRSQDPPGRVLPTAVANDDEPFLVVEAMAGG
jgi:hypothetical protein